LRRRVRDAACVFRIHLARLRAEMGPFILAALVYPSVIFLFALKVSGAAPSEARSAGFLAGALVFSLSLTAISWLGYLLLENRFTGRLKLFATLPLAASSYIFGVLAFAVAQAALGSVTLLIVARLLGVYMQINVLSIAVLSLIVMLTMLCLCGVSVTIAARVRSFAEGTLYTDTLGAGLVFFAPVFYAPNALPRGIAAVAQWLPTSCAARAVQTTLNGGFNIGTELLALVALTAFTLTLGFRVMRWREE
jgi:ABC-2 type transport system permease protein